MPTAAEYRNEAEEYVSKAYSVLYAPRRARLLEMTQSCLRLADQAELLESEGRMNGHHPACIIEAVQTQT